MEQQAGYEAAHEKLLGRTDAQGTGNLTGLRRGAFDAFVAQGIPTTRDERWKFTSLKKLADTTFILPDPPFEPTPAEVEPFDIEGLDAIRIVFVDGFFAPSLSAELSAAEGRVMQLADAIDQPNALAAQKLGELVSIDDDAFGALNTAFIEDGVFVHVPAGQAIDKPIHVLSITTDGEQPKMTHPRCLIIAEPHARVTVIEHNVSLGEGVHLTNALTEIHAADHATVHHYYLERENDAAFNISTLKIRQGVKSDVRSHTALLGGALVRNNVHPILAGDDAHCLINGLYIGQRDQHLDNHMRVEHAALRGDSRQFYKGILNDKSRGVFAGRIVVHPGAQQTDAKQTNRNLLLSDEARINAKPQLEIYADDVKCTHGATTGQIDEDMIFYLRSRGIDPETARAMMIFAFAAETFERIDLEPIEQLLKQDLLKRLPQAQVLADVL